ncbi:MAG TPA: TRAP transporter small permease [Microvirga sp.]|jgi:TRAP-type C4-dicarboxylate transport system permease small subunit|nr:TRAP transporter small permease [Microvirga sp.]
MSDPLRPGGPPPPSARTSGSSLLPDEPLPQRISRIFAWIAGAFILFGCGFLISLDVVTRTILRRGVIESFELSGYALAAAVGLGLAFTVTSKANIRVDIALDLVPRPVRRACDLLASFSLAVIALALAWYCWGTVSQSIAMNAKSVSTMQVPMVLPQGIWWVGLFWFAAMAVIVPIQAAIRLARGDVAGFDARIGSLRVDEEIEQAGVATTVAVEGGPP